MSFVAGALGGAVASAPGSLAGSTFGAVGGSIAPVALAAMNTSRLPGYLERHYLAFEKPAPT